jgi:hypothetical protein
MRILQQFLVADQTLERALTETARRKAEAISDNLSTNIAAAVNPRVPDAKLDC